MYTVKNYSEHLAIQVLLKCRYLTKQKLFQKFSQIKPVLRGVIYFISARDAPIRLSKYIFKLATQKCNPSNNYCFGSTGSPKMKKYYFTFGSQFFYSVPYVNYYYI